MGPTLFQYRLHFVFFAEVFLPHGIDRQTMGLGQLLGVALDRVPERLSELREIEDPDSPLAQVRRHAIGVAKHRQGSLYDHSVVARQYSRDLLGVTFRQ